MLFQEQKKLIKTGNYNFTLVLKPCHELSELIREHFHKPHEIRQEDDLWLKCVLVIKSDSGGNPVDCDNRKIKKSISVNNSKSSSMHLCFE